ncbi:MAG TPA: VWA domain-containing protein [Thermoanaerobaculia bacterium]|nr:VWA domain-containing protein [Thermoanaerobaculia bacterium]
MKSAALLPVLAATVLFAQSAPPAGTGSGSAPAGTQVTGPAAKSQNPPAAVPKAAEPARPDPERPFPPISERVEVSVTNVDVVVTDSKGNRVNGLTRDDFEVFQDNVPQTITNFYAVAGGKLLLEDGKEIPLDSPAAVAEIPQQLKTRYVVYIDNLNIQPQNRNRMFKRLKEFISANVGPQAEAMVVTYNRSLKVKRRFTSEKGDVLAAIEQTEMETGGGTTLAGERRDAIARINDAQSEDQAIRIARSYSQSLRNDLQFTVDAFKTSLNGLAGVEGRKIFVYVSEGLPASAGAELFDTIQKKFPGGRGTLETLDFDMNSRYASLVQAANANGVTIWALDASGLSADELVSAENRYMEARPSTFAMRQNTQAPLLMLAEQTGGMAAINTNDWKSSLDELSKDFSNFYSIGYRSTRAASDRPHSVDVKVKRKGLRVRARKGLLDKSTETRTAEAVVASLHYPRSDNPLGVSVTLGEPRPYDNENYLLPVRVAVPVGKLGLVPSGDRYEGQFFVYFVVLDALGKQSDLQVQRQAVTVPVKDFTNAQRKDFYYDVQLLVVPGGQKLAVALRDGVSNLTSYLQKNVFVSVLPKETKKTG